MSTKEVYAAVDAPSAAGGLTAGPGLWQTLAHSVRHGDARAASGSLFNGLQNTVSHLHPPTSRFCSALREAGALGTLLSGSGSAVFGLAGSEDEAHAIRRRLPPGARSKVVQTLPDGVMAAHGPLVP